MWHRLTSSPEQCGMYPHRGPPWWTAFLLPTLLTFLPWWCCSAIRAPLVPCSGAAWRRQRRNVIIIIYIFYSFKQQKIYFYHTSSTTTSSSSSLGQTSSLVASRSCLWSLRTSTGVRDQLLCDLPARRLAGRLWAFPSNLYKTKASLSPKASTCEQLQPF